MMCQKTGENSWYALVIILKGTDIAILKINDIAILKHIAMCPLKKYCNLIV